MVARQRVRLGFGACRAAWWPLELRWTAMQKQSQLARGCREQGYSSKAGWTSAAGWSTAKLSCAHPAPLDCRPQRRSQVSRSCCASKLHEGGPWRLSLLQTMRATRLCFRARTQEKVGSRQAEHEERCSARCQSCTDTGQERCPLSVYSTLSQ